MNMHGRLIINHLVAGKLTGSIASSMWETMIEDSGIENILKSWLVLDNHDNERLASLFPSQSQFRMARILQFTLPGSPCLYYGSEVGMIGMEDPEQRGSMRWDLVKKKNSFFKFHKELLTIRKKEKALKYGDFRRLHSEKLFAFMRSTDSVYDTIVVVANPTGNVVKEFLQLRESKFQDVTTLKDLLSKTTFTVHAGTIEVSVPAGKVLVLKADISKHTHGYNRYDRMK